jgi:hypothetical protein
MKTIQLELSDTIYDRVISFLELLPKDQCHILENRATERQALSEAFEVAIRSNAFADIKDPVAWQREIREDRPLPEREDL